MIKLLAAIAILSLSGCCNCHRKLAPHQLRSREIRRHLEGMTVTQVVFHPHPTKQRTQTPTAFFLLKPENTSLKGAVGQSLDIRGQTFRVCEVNWKDGTGEYTRYGAWMKPTDPPLRSPDPIWGEPNVCEPIFPIPWTKKNPDALDK